MCINTDPVTSIPKECTLQILSYLDAQQLGQCCQVSSKWHKIVSEDSLWRQLLSEIAISPNMSAQEYVRNHAVKSTREVIQRIQEFANNIQLNQKGVFTCFFPFLPACKISVELGYGHISREEDPHVKETCIFIRALPNKAGNNQVFSSSYQADKQNPGVFIFNFRITPNSKFLFYHYEIILPGAHIYEVIKDLSQYPIEIDHILKTRLTQLEVEDDQTRRRHYGIVAAVGVIGAMALNTYLSASYPNK